MLFFNTMEIDGVRMQWIAVNGYNWQLCIGPIQIDLKIHYDTLQPDQVSDFINGVAKELLTGTMTLTREGNSIKIADDCEVINISIPINVAEKFLADFEYECKRFYQCQQQLLNTE